MLKFDHAVAAAPVGKGLEDTKHYLTGTFRGLLLSSAVNKRSA
ncbi:hypothetical protein HPTD01_1886 [Halomonas sp. TD01]|nr:hypothetical protein HPTD01_1886 [Halomonas sp. TD01]